MPTSDLPSRCMGGSFPSNSPGRHQRFHNLTGGNMAACFCGLHALVTGEMRRFPYLALLFKLSLVSCLLRPSPVVVSSGICVPIFGFEEGIGGEDGHVGVWECGCKLIEGGRAPLGGVFLHVFLKVLAVWHWRFTHLLLSSAPSTQPGGQGWIFFMPVGHCLTQSRALRRC